MGVGSEDDAGEHAEENRFPRLLLDYRQGDESARAQIVELLQVEIVNTSGHQLEKAIRSKAGVSDIVQSSLLSAAMNLDQFSGTTWAEFRAWVRAIVTNEANGVRRQFHAAKRDVRREGHLDSVSTPSVSPADLQLTPSSEAIAQERRERFHLVLHEMTPEHQQVIQLRSLEEKSFKEIADIMNRTEAAVAQLWYRAILKFEEKLKQSGDFQSGIN